MTEPEPVPRPEWADEAEQACSAARFLAEHLPDREIVLGPDLAIHVSPAGQEPRP